MTETTVVVTGTIMTNPATAFVGTLDGEPSGTTIVHDVETQVTAPTTCVQPGTTVVVPMSTEVVHDVRFSFRL